MRVFLCSYDGFSVAIPMNSVASLIIHKSAPDESSRAIEHDSASNNTYISLPLLLGNPQAVIRHGILLKNSGNEEQDETEDIIKNKTILLTTEVECEQQIPDKNIFPVPKILGVFDFSSIFNRISFNSRNIILFFNTEKFNNKTGSAA
ncbi:MAG: hypothetical protein FWC03_01875 [Treponema sp.]|nr:hypothetical protein [Treponema sp.]